MAARERTECDKRMQRVMRELEVTLNIGTLECLETRFLKGGGIVSERGVSTLRQSKMLRLEK